MAKISAKSQQAAKPFGLISSNADFTPLGCGIVQQCCDSGCCPLHDNRDKKTLE